MAGPKVPGPLFAFSAAAGLGLMLLAAYLTWRSNIPTPAPRFDPAVLLEPGAGDFPPIDHDRPLVFPEDHGAHGQTRGELWRFVGTVRDREAEPFGFQLAFYRLSLGNRPGERASAWAANQIYRAQFAITPSGGDGFESYERVSRGALGLAGFHSGDARVWVENWSMRPARDAGGTSSFKIEAGQAGAAMGLTLTPSKKIVETGTAGPLRYYPMSRLRATGRLNLAGKPIEVSGEGYFEHAWGNLPPGGGPVAWNRYVIQLDDGRELVLGQSRRRDGGGTPIGSGVLIAEDGSFSALNHRDLELAPKAFWRSAVTGVNYPSGWHVRVSKAGLDLLLDPLVPDQETDHSMRSWSGAMTISGTSAGKPVSGFAHAELTGY